MPPLGKVAAIAARYGVVVERPADVSNAIQAQR
jgi:hypothetical protein